MTDPKTADVTYIEPLTVEVIERIIIQEKIDAYLSTMGGQIALKFALDFERLGFNKKYGFKIIGSTAEVIRNAEDRNLFREILKQNELPAPRGFSFDSFEEVSINTSAINFPVIARTSFSLGGKGSQVIDGEEDLISYSKDFFDRVPQGKIEIEQYLEGWKEFELEVVRDNKGNSIVVCGIENLNPMGVHTGDSITVSPIITLNDKEYQRMRKLAFLTLDAVGMRVGGANVQFAVNPKNGEIAIIEMNPRVSRSSALASKVTGYPIARVTAKMSVGLNLDEIQNDTNLITAALEPSIDYVAVKFPKFNFEKFSDVEVKLGTTMKSIGSAIGIAKTFPEALQKSIRGAFNSTYGLVGRMYQIKASDFPSCLSEKHPNQIFLIARELYAGKNIEFICNRCKWDRWFVRYLKLIVDSFQSMNKDVGGDFSLFYAYLKRLGFSDKELKDFFPSNAGLNDNICEFNDKLVYSKIDSTSGEFPLESKCYFSSNTLFSPFVSGKERNISPAKKVLILGSGPNSIGQGIEFDYACVKASESVRKMGFESIIINSNPETVSTDHSASDKLYISPINIEDVSNIILNESSTGEIYGLLACYGGQVALNLVKELSTKVKVLGTSHASINTAEDRDSFYSYLSYANIPHPLKFSKSKILEGYDIKFPVILRPSFVTGGSSIYKVSSMDRLVELVSCDENFLVEEFIEEAKEFEIDAISDGSKTYFASIVEQVEKSGVHSGDSQSIFPAQNIEEKFIRQAKKYTEKIAHDFNIIGLFNVQFLIKGDQVYVIELNPRASRTVPFIIKASGINFIDIATRVLLGEKLKDMELPTPLRNSGFVSIKKPVFSNKLLGAKIQLKPEMQSTGEEMYIDRSFETALGKSNLANGFRMSKMQSLCILQDRVIHA